MFPYDASKPDQSVSTNHTIEDEFPCQRKSAVSETNVTYSKYNELLEAYNKACHVIDILTKDIINQHQEIADIKQELGKLYVKVGKSYVEHADGIKDDKVDEILKIGKSIDRSFFNEKDDQSECSKPDPDPDQITMNDLLNLRMRSITAKDYPKANYEVTAKN